jgi:exonuclease III
VTRNGFGISPRIPAEQRFSRKYRGRQELIDHIFVSHALVGKMAQDDVITDAAGPTPSIDDDPTQRRGAPGSDHRPVLASIDL